MDILNVKEFQMVAYYAVDDFNDGVNRFLKKGFVLFGKPGIYSDRKRTFMAQAMILIDDVKEIENEEDDEPMSARDLYEIK